MWSLDYAPEAAVCALFACIMGTAVLLFAIWAVGTFIEWITPHVRIK